MYSVPRPDDNKLTLFYSLKYIAHDKSGNYISYNNN